MQILVINLGDAADRWAHCREAFGSAGLDPQRLEATDGRVQEQAVIDAAFDRGENRREYFVPLHRGEIGCFLSHRAAWQRVADGHDKYGMIAEDDIEITGDLEAVLRAVEERQPPFDVLKLDARVTEPFVTERPLTEVHDCVRAAVPSLDMAGYVVSREGARKLLQAFPRIHMPVDVHLQFWWRHDLRVWSLAPAVIRQFPVLQEASTLKKRKKAGTLMDKLRREIRRPLFRARLRREARRHFQEPQKTQESP